MLAFKRSRAWVMLEGLCGDWRKFFGLCVVLDVLGLGPTLDEVSGSFFLGLDVVVGC